MNIIGLNETMLQQPFQVLEFNFAPSETLLGTPEALPTAEPANPQVSYTIQASNLPCGILNGDIIYTAMLIVAGKNTANSDKTCYFRTLKNGGSVNTSSISVTKAYYYTWSFYHFYNVTAGDVLACKLWGSTSLNWDYKALLVFPTRVRITQNDLAVLDVEYYIETHPNLTLGNPLQSYSLTNSPFRPYFGDVELSKIEADKLYEVMYYKKDYHTGRLGEGDYNQSYSNAINADFRPYYRTTKALKKIKFRKTTARVF